MKDFRQLLLDAYRSQAENTAFEVNGAAWTYDQFFARVFAISTYLESAGQRVGVIIQHDLDTYAAVVATWWTARTYLPIDQAQSGTLAAGLQAQEADVILCSQDLEIPGYDIVCTGELSANESPAPTAAPDEAIAYELSTSGTTGRSKQVPISYENLSAFVDSFLAMGHDLRPADRFIQQAEMCFDMSIISFLVPLCVGASVHPVRMTGVRHIEVLRALTEKHLTVLITTPSTVELLQPFYDELSLPDLRLTYFGAEKLSTTTAQQWTTCAPNSKMINLYGPSEGGIYSTWHQWDPATDQGDSVPIGREVKHVETCLFPVAEAASEAGEVGELLIRGPQVFAGYTDPALNRVAFVEFQGHRWYRTGDVVQRNGNGAMTFVRRVDQQVKVQGKRVELELITHTINTHWPDANPLVMVEGTGAQARIVLTVEQAIDMDEAAQKLNQELPAFYPKIDLRVVDGFARNKRHLFALLDDCADSSAVQALTHSDFRAVKTDGAAWPNFLYHVHPSPAVIREMAAHIRKDQAPPFLLLDIPSAEAFEEDLREAGFRPYLNWTLQQLTGLNASHYEKGIVQTLEHSFEPVRSEAELAEWMAIASTGFGRLDRRVFETLSSKGTELFLTRLGQSAVASSLIFYHEGEAGIYHLVTHPVFRGQSLGKATYFRCLKHIHEQGISNIRIQSNHATRDLWGSLGMEDCGNLFLLIHQHENHR